MPLSSNCAAPSITRSQPLGGVDPNFPFEIKPVASKQAVLYHLYRKSWGIRRIQSNAKAIVVSVVRVNWGKSPEPHRANRILREHLEVVVAVAEEIRNRAGPVLRVL
jgi:hypothetical protein